MSEYRRARVAGASYFFTVVTWQRQLLFTDDIPVEMLRQAFRKTMKNRPFEIEAIVVLPDHLHSLWRLPEGDTDYSSRWREIKKAFSRRITTDTNARNERLVWQRRFWEHVIRDDRDWRHHLDYIHYNPVKHGLALRPGDWPWSSFRSAVEKGWYDPDWGSQPPDPLIEVRE